MLDYSFNKAPIGKGISYPLKRSALDAAIALAGIEQLGWVYYSRGVPTYLLRAYRFGDSNKGLGRGLSTIVVCSVPSAVRKEIEAAILDECLPKMLGWLKSIELSENTRRGSDQFFAARYIDGTLHYEAT